MAATSAIMAAPCAHGASEHAHRGVENLAALAFVTRTPGLDQGVGARPGRQRNVVHAHHARRRSLARPRREPGRPVLRHAADGGFSLALPAETLVSADRSIFAPCTLEPFFRVERSHGVDIRRDRRAFEPSNLLRPASTGERHVAAADANQRVIGPLDRSRHSQICLRGRAVSRLVAAHSAGWYSATNRAPAVATDAQRQGPVQAAAAGPGGGDARLRGPRTWNRRSCPAGRPVRLRRTTRRSSRRRRRGADISTARAHARRPPTELSHAASLGDDSLCRARIPELSRPRLRLYLKSMGASTHGNPQELKDRLLQLFVLNDIDPDEPQVRFDALKWYHPNDTYVSVWDENAKKWDEVQVRRTVVRITKVPASARNIAALAVPSNSRFVEGELAALHTAWEAEVKSA